MARKSNETKARELAAKLGVELDADPGGMDTFTVEVWSYGAHLHEAGNPGCHTYFSHHEPDGEYSFDLTTIPKVWADVISYMQDLKPCERDCDCWKEGFVVSPPVCTCPPFDLREFDGPEDHAAACSTCPTHGTGV